MIARDRALGPDLERARRAEEAVADVGFTPRRDRHRPVLEGDVAEVGAHRDRLPARRRPAPGPQREVHAVVVEPEPRDRRGVPPVEVESLPVGVTSAARSSFRLLPGRPAPRGCRGLARYRPADAAARRNPYHNTTSSSISHRHRQSPFIITSQPQPQTLTNHLQPISPPTCCSSYNLNTTEKKSKDNPHDHQLMYNQINTPTSQSAHTLNLTKHHTPTSN